MKEVFAKFRFIGRAEITWPVNCLRTEQKNRSGKVYKTIIVILDNFKEIIQYFARNAPIVVETIISLLLDITQNRDSSCKEKKLLRRS